MAGSDVKDPPPVEDLDLPDLDALFSEDAPDTGVTEAAPPPPARKAPPAKASKKAPKLEEPPADLPDFITESEEPPPPPPPMDEPAGDFLSDQSKFRREAQELARARDWNRLAGLIGAALDAAGWADPPEVKVSLLFDLARVHRDRLHDLESAEAAFRRLIDIEPAHAEALQFLSERYEHNGDWQSLYLLTTGAIEATWDPAARLDWTRKAVAIAEERLGSPDLVLDAWERLWNLGDFPEEAASALSEAYRRGARWDRLASFLKRQAELATGSARVVALREVAEAYLSALRSQEPAAEVLKAILAARPHDAVALLGMARVHARTRDWDALEGLGTGQVTPASAVLDVQRLVVDALWNGEELDRAARVCERILARDPRDPEALRMREDFLSRSGKTEALVAFLSARAKEAPNDQERSELLQRAAGIAERELDAPRQAAELLERRAAIATVRLEALRDLARLYETIGDHEGLKRALEGELALARNPQARIELLRRLAEHCAHRLGDDARAEVCWRDLLAAVPDDPTVRDELVELYRRRGDFAAVDRTLVAAAWRPLDDAALLLLWRQAAQNVQDNLGDRPLAVRAWRRVLDQSPDDGEALQATVAHCRALWASDGDLHDLIGSVERAARLADPAERLQMTLEIAQKWEGAGDGAAAAAAYERVLAWEPRHVEALAALVRLKPNASTRGTLDVAVAAAESADERAALLRQSLALMPLEDALGRLFLLKRLLTVAGPSPEVMSQLSEAAAKAGAWEELAAVYTELAAGAGEKDLARWSGELAALYEQRLRDPLRALLTLQVARQPAVANLDELSALLRLAEATNRPEDALALLELATRRGVPPEVRRDAIRRKVALCEKLNLATRAFSECARLLALDGADDQALATARRLAGSAGLWRHLDALYGELRDRAPGDAARLRLTLERQRIRGEELHDPAAALDELLVAFRIDPGVQGQLLEAARAQRAWDDVVPAVEGRLLAARDPSADELERVARLHHVERKDPRRALALYRLAFEAQPLPETEAVLTELAVSKQEQAALTESLRTAAARAGGSPRALELYRGAAALYAERLGRPDLALDVHQRILQLQPAELASLRVVIQHQREAGLWRELRDSLQRWIELGGDGNKNDTLLEIARLSRTQLSDAETALATYARVLGADPGNSEALDGIRALTEGPIDATLQLRRLRIELEQTRGEARAPLLLKCAELQERELDDPQGALTTLSALVAESAADGAGAAALIALQERRGAWADAVETRIARAAALPEPAARTASLREALELAEEHKLPAELQERLCRQILALEPDRRTAQRLLMLLRSTGRYADQVKLLEQLDEPLFEDERVLLLANALDRPDEALRLVEARLKAAPDDASALAWQATLLLHKGDVRAAIAVRERQAQKGRPALGALVLCHLAEVREEGGAPLPEVIEQYRAARALDNGCLPAMEALKALGRRTRNWREAAALLPESDVKGVSWAERAARLRERGDASVAADAAVALSWYERAVAVDADDHLAWDALADTYASRGEQAEALEARRASVAAYERATRPDPKRLEEHARRIQRLAEMEAAAGHAEEAIGLARRAFELMPSLPAPALAVAEQLQSEGDPTHALAVYDQLLSHPESLSNEERLRARYGRGQIAAQLDRLDAAIDDLRDGLRFAPLHPGLLQALADVLTRKRRFAAALQHYVSALLLADDAPARAALYSRIGRLWEEQLENPEEAGVCYDLAIAHGSDDADVMARALGHYRRTQNGERAQAVIERLLPMTTDPRTLAMLWSERGRIFSSQNGDAAMEAFDLALSYDPSCQAAVSGLAALLEQRGDWKQLVDLLEVRAESGSAESRAESLRALARITRDHLNNPARTAQLLNEAVRLAPRKEDYDELIALYGDDPKRTAERWDAIAARLGVAGPWMSQLVDLARALSGDGRRRWAWCLVSPLMNAGVTDPATKSLVFELRKEFEKTDNVEVLTAARVLALQHPDLPPALWEVLEELEVLVAGPSGLEAAGVSGASPLDARTAIGKSFAALAERLGMPDAQLYRASELSSAIRVLGGSRPEIIVRSELLAPMAPGEITFLLVFALASARPGARLLSSAPERAPQLLNALYAAAGLSDAPAPAELIEKIRSAGSFGAWREKLRAASPLPADRILQALRASVLGAGLLAMPDLRYALKALGRIDDSVPKLPSAGRLDDLDAVFAESSAARSLAALAASTRFGNQL